MSNTTYHQNRNNIIKKSIMPLLVFYITGTHVYCQKLNEDSIKKIIAETSSDTMRILAERKLASYYILHKGKDSIGLALLEKADKEAKKINFQTGICEVLLTRGNYYFKKNDWGNAISTFGELVEQSHFVKDSFYNKRTRMIGLNNLAGIFTQNGDYTKALDYYFKSRDILETLKPDSNAFCTIYVNIAAIYNVLDQSKKAEEYLAKCYPFINASRPNLRYLYWQEKQNLADKYKDANSFALAIDSLEKTIKTSTLSDFQQMQYNETLLEMKGKYKSQYLKDYSGAFENFTSLLDLAEKMDDKPVINNALYEIGNCYYLQGDIKQATSFLEKAYKGAVADSVNQVVFTSSKLLSGIYMQQKNNDKALHYLSIAYKLNDSLNTQKNLTQLNFLEASYQNEKKEKEIVQLKIANTEKQLAVVKRNRILLITGLSAITLLLVAALLYRNSKKDQIIAEKEKKLQEEQIKFLERQQQVTSLQSMINGQETERTRIAKDLHDGLGGIFSTVKMHYSTLQQDTPLIKENLLYKKTLDLINNASDELRRVAHNMMPEVLMKVGLVEALQDFCNNISSGKLLTITFQSFGMEERLSSSTEIILYRIVQELVNNIIKHAYASAAIIQINRQGSRLSLTIEDNGRGFDTRDAEEKRTMGMITVKSRVDYLNGKLTIDSRKDIGTTVMIDLLLNEG
jgi:two-component system, NarL family, sensor kinase